MQNNLIALYSPVPQSGKSEFAKIATDNFDYVPIPFAKPLKDMLSVILCSAYNPATVREMLYGNQKGLPLFPFGNRTPRELMQTLGTDWGRNSVSPDLWILPWKAQVAFAIKNGLKVIVDDMRFPNEFKAVEELGGLTVRIERPDANPANGHESEGQLSRLSFGCTLFNRKSLSDWHGYCRETLLYIQAAI